MTQVKKYPREFVMVGKGACVTVQFYLDPEGLEHVNTIVTSKALPDERQVKIRHRKYIDGNILMAEQSKKLPKPRAPDPMDPELAIRGELLGLYGVLEQKYFPGTLAERIIKMEGGFGCNADGIGRKLFGRYVCDGRDFAGRRGDVSRFASTAEVEAAKQFGKK